MPDAKNPEEPDNLVSLEASRARKLASELVAIALPGLEACQLLAIALGDRVLAGETIDPNDIDDAAGVGDGEFDATFARQYPDLLAGRWKILPASRIRLLSVLERPALDARWCA
jgi:hypothetical protein